MSREASATLHAGFIGVALIYEGTRMVDSSLSFYKSNQKSRIMDLARLANGFIAQLRSRTLILWLASVALMLLSLIHI